MYPRFDRATALSMLDPPTHNEADHHLGALAKKNRLRSPYSFANINLLGRCNVDCYFCLGKDLDTEYSRHRNLGEHFSNWQRWNDFIAVVKALEIPWVFVTGQNTDSLTYSRLGELLKHLRSIGLKAGIRTNGVLAKKLIDTVNLAQSVSYSIHTRDPETQRRIMGITEVPDWDWLLRNTICDRLRVAVVLNRYNRQEIYDLLEWLGTFDRIGYVQVRKICTDNRYELLRQDMQIFEDFEQEVAAKFPVARIFETANVYLMFGREVAFWRTVATTVNSVNYFTNGTLTGNYFIVEGYSEQNLIPLGTTEFLSPDGLTFSWLKRDGKLADAREALLPARG